VNDFFKVLEYFSHISNSEKQMEKVSKIQAIQKYKVVAKDKLSSYGAHPATVQSLLKWSF
jgi:hypothetical protein